MVVADAKQITGHQIKTRISKRTIPWWSRCPWRCCGSTGGSTSARTSWSVHEDSRRRGCPRWTEYIQYITVHGTEYSQGNSWTQEHGDSRKPSRLSKQHIVPALHEQLRITSWKQIGGKKTAIFQQLIFTEPRSTPSEPANYTDRKELTILPKTASNETTVIFCGEVRRDREAGSAYHTREPSP
jgi:hypothetical protein